MTPMDSDPEISDQAACSDEGGAGDQSPFLQGKRPWGKGCSVKQSHVRRETQGNLDIASGKAQFRRLRFCRILRLQPLVFSGARLFCLALPASVTVVVQGRQFPPSLGSPLCCAGEGQRGPNQSGFGCEDVRLGQFYLLDVWMPYHVCARPAQPCANRLQERVDVSSNEPRLVQVNCILAPCIIHNRDGAKNFWARLCVGSRQQRVFAESYQRGFGSEGCKKSHGLFLPWSTAFAGGWVGVRVLDILVPRLNGERPRALEARYRSSRQRS